MFVFRFDFDKTCQAVAYLLKLSGGRMNYTKLIKLLYIADRESLRENGFPITGDTPVAMKNGPVQSLTYDLIKGDAEDAPAWSRFFKTEERDLVLREDPSEGKLCRYEVDKLDEVYNQYKSKDFGAMIDIVHEFEEWKRNDPGDSSKLIPLEDILEAVGRAKDIDMIKEEAEAAEQLDQAFQES